MSISALISILTTMGGHPVMTDSIGNYRQYQMADSCVYETLDYGDSTLVVKTICAPICNSIVGVYDSNGNKLRSIPGIGILPYATIKDDVLVWEDRGVELLDEEEKSPKIAGE